MTTIGRVTTPTFSASLKVFGGEVTFGRGPIMPPLFRDLEPRMEPHNLVGSTILRAEDTRVGQGIRAHAIKNPFKEEGAITAEDVPKAVEEAQRIVTEPIKAPKTQTIERPKERASLPVESLLMLVVARNLLPISSEIAVNLNQLATPHSAVEKTALKTEGQLIFSKAQPLAAPLQAVHTQEEEETEEKISTERVVKQKREQKDQPQTKSSEKTTQLKVKLVEAVAVSKNRVRVLWESYQKVKAEGLSLKWLRKSLGVSYWQHLSPIAKGGFDGTLDPTVREVEAYGDRIKDDQEAENTFESAVSNHIPVEEGEVGRIATVEEVREVREGKEKEKENLRSNSPVDIVIKRVVVRENERVASIGQAVNVTVEEKEEVTGEPTLKSLGLEEIFQKATA